MLNFEENPIKTLRMLKGAPLSVYVAIYLVKQTVSIKWIEMVTGYSDKPVTKAIKLLSEYELISKNKNGFYISNSKQLRLAEEKRENKKYEILKEFGVGEPVLSEIAFNNEISTEYVETHINKAVRENISTGLLIHRIKSRDEVKKDDSNDYRRYLRGEYGSFGNN